MTPADQSAGMVPLQARYEGVPGQPGGPTVVQYTTVNIASEPPRDHIVWSIFSFVWANFCCLGLAALIHSVKSRDRKMAGDLEGAKRHGSTARCLNITVAIMVLITLIIFIVMLYNMTAQLQSYRYGYGYGY